MMTLNMNKIESTEIVKGLSHILADTYILYLKTQNYHWNVTGKSFQQLHLLFEGQYKEMALAIDSIAERIRALGHKSPGSLKEFQELTSIKDDSGIENAAQMIESLIRVNETISQKAKEVSSIAKKYTDDVSSDLLTTRINSHDKFSWMLGSLKE